MNFRTATTASISIVFITLSSTGILLYAVPWNYFVGAIHVWASLFFIAGTILHFKNNLKVYLSHVKKRAGRRSFLYCGLGLLALVIGLVLGVAPFSTHHGC